MQSLLRQDSAGVMVNRYPLTLATAAMLAAACYTCNVNADYSLHQVASGSFYHQGLHQDYTPENHGDIANVGFVIGKRCVAVIDTGGSPSLGRKLLAAIRSQTSLPICYVINTHVHPDHVLGNSAFAGEHAQIVGHSAMVQAIAANRQYFIDEFLTKVNEPLTPEQIVAPDRLVDGTTRIDLGERVLRVQSYAKAHTATDLTVYDESSHTLWMGDLLFVDRIPALDGSITGWLGVLHKLSLADAKQVVPGHGPMLHSWKAKLAAQMRYLQNMVTGIRSLIKHGGTLEQALATVGRKERGQWRLFDAYHKRNVSKAFTELEWE